MFSRIHTWLMAAGLVFGSVTVASAERGSGTKQTQTKQTQTKQTQAKQTQAKQTKAKQTQAKQSRQMKVSGRLIAMKSVQVKGANERNTVAMIRTQQGQRRIVDLGPRTQARTLKLSRGDQLTVRGRKANIQGRQVIVAHQARTADGDMIRIDRSEQRKRFDQRVRNAHQQRRAQQDRRRQQQQQQQQQRRETNKDQG